MRTMKFLGLALVAGLLMSSASAVTTNEYTVAEGVTKTLADLESDLGVSLATDDVIVKKGDGVLQALATFKNLKFHVIIEEGIFDIPSEFANAKKGSITVKDGACLYIHTTAVTLNGWTIYLEGEGTGVYPYLGAVSVKGSAGNGQVNFCTFNMTGDATIFTYDGDNDYVFSGSSRTDGTTLVMNAHTLTVKGRTTTSMFRPRWRMSITKSGPFVVDNIFFARHADSASTMDDYNPYVPCFKIVNGAIISLDGYYYKKVNEFDFAYGTTMGKTSKGGGTATPTLKALTGCPTITADATATVSGTFTVRGTDLVLGQHLTSVNAFTLASGSKLAVKDWGTLSFAPGASYVVAEATAGIVGTPTLTGSAADVFTIENSGTALTLVAKSSNKVPALLEGAENAAANSQVMAALTLADDDVICFPAGEYHFSEPIDFSASTASGVTLCGLTEAPCTLRAPLKLGAMQTVAVRNLKFKDLTTPAIVATGTAGLTVEGCTLEAVKGTYGELGNFPYAFVNVTDLKVKDPVYVQDAAEAESTLWDGAAYFDGGTQTADSVARANEIVAYIPGGVWEANWRSFDDYMNGEYHLTNSATAGKLLRKTGPATLDVTSSNEFTSVEIEKGQLVSRKDSAFGVAKGPVHVCSGANLTIAGGNRAIYDRKVTFSGTGLSVENPAVRITGDAKWDKCQYVDWTLEGDATMYNNCSGACGTFLWGKVHMAGHALTLKGIAKANYRFGRVFDWYGAGTMIVDGVTLSSSSAASGATDYAVKDKAGRPLFKFVNGAKLVPDNADIFNLIKDVDFAAGTWLKPSSATACTLATLTGPMTATNVTGVTITERLSARVADLTAGNAAKVYGPLAFADNVTVTLVADSLAAPEDEYTLVSAEDGITGQRPKLDAAARSAGWGLRWGPERKSLVAGPKSGAAILVR